MKKASSKNLPTAKNAPARPNPVSQLIEAARRDELVAIIGTGVSMSLTDGSIPELSWKGLLESGFKYGLKKGKISDQQAAAWRPQLDSTDLDDLLGAAEFLARKLESPNGALYALWLKSVFDKITASNIQMRDGILALQKEHIPICTLNYDLLLEHITGLPAITINETAKVGAWMRRETPGILHLHGTWDQPSTCILGIRDYETTLGSDVRDLIQRSLASFNRLLFIGCGDTFQDPNFSALIQWLRSKMPAAIPQHYALIRDTDVSTKESDSSWHGFVDPIGYGPSHSDLPKYIIKYFGSSRAISSNTRRSSAKPQRLKSQNRSLLDAYKSYLIKDCGQMTIEGVRADMDTAQRRFDLERLFVPLTILQCPPHIPESDPKKEEKLTKWKDENLDAKSFGEVFKSQKRLALLALPGGGKSLLLKRIAVAYADSSRLNASNDNLPNLQIIPILIRCREWREHIHKPILTILNSIHEITGQPNLFGLNKAILPELKKGSVLLLIDGLDEIHDDAVRSIFVDHLETFLNEYKETRLVVTSREAGFSLVAPVISRFCARWHIGPLNNDAITQLCNYWHRLMNGDSEAAYAEAKDVADHIIQNAPLHRLAENPLLLTMLLVVKHGAGRLPPDRVSLYSRAVEVLLDTWNIKGHAPLNPKEAVPQLAFIAFKLMESGKQTATERELLRMLDEARDKVPQIKRYAKDTPHEFLKRVELRSSLLMEAGHQLEDGHTVPFYQFRHLTFQEYLAAEAAVQGHYIGYEKEDTVNTPLSRHIIDEKWKEVIPMAAVLAKKQAEPLITELIKHGAELRRKLEEKNENEINKTLNIPAPIWLLLQCLSEEAEAAPDSLTAALGLIAFFANGFSYSDSFTNICRGPYSDDLFHQAWLIYDTMIWPESTSMVNTCAMLATARKPIDYWYSKEGSGYLEQRLASGVTDQVGRSLLTYCGLAWNHSIWANEATARTFPIAVQQLEPFILKNEPSLWVAASWAWALLHYHSKQRPKPSAMVLDRLMNLWLDDPNPLLSGRASIVLYSQFGFDRDSWRPLLSPSQAKKVKALATTKYIHNKYDMQAALLVSFHSRAVFTESEIAKLIADARRNTDFKHPHRGNVPNLMLKQIDEEARPSQRGRAEKR